MRRKQEAKSDSAEKTVRDIRRATRRPHAAEEKIRIVLEGLRGEDSIAELCRRESIAQSLYYKWSKEFLEAGKKRLAGDTAREATRSAIFSPPWPASSAATWPIRRRASWSMARGATRRSSSAAMGSYWASITRTTP